MERLILRGQAEGLNRKIRSEMIQVLLDFYHLHLESLGEIKSLDVLHEVLS